MGSDACSIESLATFEVSMWANGRLETSKGGKGMFFLFLHPTSLGGVAKKRTASCPLFWGGQGDGLEDVGHLTDPGQTNGQGPVLFFGQKAALSDPGQANGQGPVLFLWAKHGPSRPWPNERPGSSAF